MISGRWAKTIATIGLSIGMASAEAHAHLRSSMPANGSTLTASPARAVLDFSEPARLTAAWIQKIGGAKQKLASLPAQAAGELAVPLPSLGAGQYELTWRALSADGHIMPGHIRFTVSGTH